MSLTDFKQRLRKEIDAQGFPCVPDVLLEIENCQVVSIHYNKTTLTSLRNQTTQQLNQLAETNFLAGVKAFIDSIQELDTAKVFYSKRQTLDNPIFIRFILLNRDKYLGNIRQSTQTN